MPIFWRIHESPLNLYSKLSRELKHYLDRLVKKTHPANNSHNNTKSSQDDCGLEMRAHHRYNYKSTSNISHSNHKEVLLKGHTYKIFL